MTSLAEQLRRLALPQSDPSLLSRAEAASLLFDCKEAAAVDRDTFFAIGELGASRGRRGKIRLSGRAVRACPEPRRGRRSRSGCSSGGQCRGMLGAGGVEGLFQP